MLMLMRHHSSRGWRYMRPRDAGLAAATLMVVDADSDPGAPEQTRLVTQDIVGNPVYHAWTTALASSAWTQDVLAYGTFPAHWQEPRRFNPEPPQYYDPQPPCRELCPLPDHQIARHEQWQAQVQNGPVPPPPTYHASTTLCKCHDPHSQGTAPFGGPLPEVRAAIPPAAPVSPPTTAKGLEPPPMKPPPPTAPEGTAPRLLVPQEPETAGPAAQLPRGLPSPHLGGPENVAKRPPPPPPGLSQGPAPTMPPWMQHPPLPLAGPAVEAAAPAAEQGCSLTRWLHGSKNDSTPACNKWQQWSTSSRSWAKM